MKKVLNFMVNTKKGEKIYNTTTAIFMVSLVIGMTLTTPALWLGNAYEGTWMNMVAPYFFYIFLTYAGLVVLLFIPYIWYVSTSQEYKGNSRMIMKAVAVFCSILPGVIIYRTITEALSIPSGIESIIGGLACGFVYLAIIKRVFYKPFKVIQTFLPLS